MDNNTPSLHDREFMKKLSSIGESPSDMAYADGQDLLRLAAWMDHRLSEEESEPIELALAHDPQLLSDILLLSREIEEAPVAAVLSQRLMGLVPGDQVASATLIPFAARRQAPPRKSAAIWLSWCAIAASVAVISLVGFDLGTFMEKHSVSQTATSDYLQVPNDDVD